MSRPGSFARPSKRLAIFLRDNLVCVYCTSSYPTVALTLDHVTIGKGHAPTNLVTACHDCNSSRRAISVSAFCLTRGWRPSIVWRRINKATARDIEPFRRVAVLLWERGVPPWMNGLPGCSSDPDVGF